MLSETGYINRSENRENIEGISKVILFVKNLSRMFKGAKKGRLHCQIYFQNVEKLFN